MQPIVSSSGRCASGSYPMRTCGPFARNRLPVPLIHTTFKSNAIHASSSGKDTEAVLSQQPYSGRVGFTEAYNKAFTMSQLYGLDRPEPIPLTEHQERGKKRAVAEIVEAGRRKGKPQAAIHEGLDLLEQLLPGLISLHKAKASEFATMAVDAGGVMDKVIALKTAWPKANVHHVLVKRPKLLLHKLESLVSESAKVRSLLQGAESADAIITSLPDLLDSITLSRTMAMLRESFRGQDPVMLLQSKPEVVLNMLGESEIEDSAEYGELSTRD